jgi:hypothetical protein
MGNLELLTYGEVDQRKLNQTDQTVELFLRNGNTATYAWNLQDGPLPGEPFSFDDLAEIKAVLNTVEVIYFKFENVDIGRGYVWDLTVKV